MNMQNFSIRAKISHKMGIYPIRPLILYFANLIILVIGLRSLWFDPRNLIR
jgi:hypothetical protein